MVALCALLLWVGTSEAASLRGSKASLHRQNAQAHKLDYTYLRTSAQVRKFAEHGYLVPIRESSHLELASVSFPYARPEVELFLTRLGAQYHAACGEKIVVTSLTRPTTRQPRNASPLSVHPTGMAMDLRRSNSRACRSWLERTLLSLENANVLEATKEHRPPHYHVALYSSRYVDYVERITGTRPSVGGGGASSYTVRQGDTLWEIAQKHDSTVASIKRANNMRSSLIKPGQRLVIP